MPLTRLPIVALLAAIFTAGATAAEWVERGSLASVCGTFLHHSSAQLSGDRNWAAIGYPLNANGYPVYSNDLTEPAN